LRLLASLYTLAQRISSPQRTMKTMASLPLISWRITASTTPSSTSGSSLLGIFMGVFVTRFNEDGRDYGGFSGGRHTGFKTGSLSELRGPTGWQKAKQLYIFYL